jgi:hypothetical protein
VATLIGVLFAVLIGEIGVRYFLFHGNYETLPLKIGNNYSEDANYRFLLRNRLREHKQDFAFPRFHPMLGWTKEPSTPDNPMGLDQRDLARLRAIPGNRKILFFGDSFIAGYTPPDVRIPQLLEEKLEHSTVLNLGVGGYGLDQMYLFLSTLSPMVDTAHVIVGVFYNDIDRCLFELREAPKPFFRVRETNLILSGVPLPSDPLQWLRQYPPPEKSYLAAAFDGLLYRVCTSRFVVERAFWLHPSETAARRPEKVAIASHLFENFREACRIRGFRLTIVLFPFKEHLVHDGWYEAFARDTLTRMGIDYVDLKPALAKRVNDRHLKWWKDVYTEREHPSEEENLVFATEIAKHLHQEFGY